MFSANGFPERQRGLAEKWTRPQTLQFSWIVDMAPFPSRLIGVLPARQHQDNPAEGM
jgi:hypothetical protein